MILEGIGAIALIFETLIISTEYLSDDLNCCVLPILAAALFIYAISNNIIRILILCALTLVTYYILSKDSSQEDDNVPFYNNSPQTYTFENKSDTPSNNPYDKNNTDSVYENSYYKPDNTKKYDNNYYDRIVDDYGSKEKVKIRDKSIPKPNNPYAENTTTTEHKNPFTQTKRFKSKNHVTQKNNYNSNKRNVQKINVNTASLDKLMKLPHIWDHRANQIIQYRITKNIESMDEFADVASLANSEKMDLMDYVKFTDEELQDNQSINKLLDEIKNEREQIRSEHEQIKNEYEQIKNEREELQKEKEEFDQRIEEKLNLPKEESDSQADMKPVDEKVIPVMDINTANADDLAKLPGINIIKAKKIVQLRESGIYIKSFDDLRDRLNLKDYEVEQLKPYVKISMDESNNGQRRLDL